MYFANNEGLLCFDGTYWSKTPLPNQTIVRSIDIDRKGRIYAGGQDELGFYSPSPNGTLSFTSLTHLIPSTDKTFEDVWDIICLDQTVFFRTNSKIFEFSNQTMRIYRAPREWIFMGLCNNRVYAQDRKMGLMLYDGQNWTPQGGFPNQPETEGPITGMLSHQGKIFLSTLKKGLFVYSDSKAQPVASPDIDKISAQRIYSLQYADDEHLALGTSNGGLHIIHPDGRLVQHFSIKQGLQNNNVLYTFKDSKGNLWLGLDNGIDYIAYNSPVKQIITDEQGASGYTCVVHDNHLFIGTSSGLYQTPLQNTVDLSFSRGVFQQIPGTQGQVWGLSQVNGKLLMGHHEGLFQVSISGSSPLMSDAGYWNISAMQAREGHDRAISGFYKGLRFFDVRDNHIRPGDSLSGFSESSRYFETDAQGNIWVSHPYHGVFRIHPAGTGGHTITKIDTRLGLPMPLNNFVFRIRNRICIATEKGVYTYNEKQQRLAPDSSFQTWLGEQSIRYLKEDREGNIWYIHDKQLGIIDFSGSEPRTYLLPELGNQMLSGFEYIYPINQKNIFLGGEKGFHLINMEKYRSQPGDLNVRLYAVKIINQTDSTLFGGFSPPGDTGGESTIPSVQYDWKNLHFEFSSPEYGRNKNIQYSYQLMGYDRAWSAWASKSEKDYTNLPPGKYTFQVRARNQLGTISPSAAYTFFILPPWYRTNWAYATYLLLLMLLGLMLYTRYRNKLNRQKERYEAEQQQLQYLHQLEMDKTEGELINLRNEKLQTEIEFKNSELANTAMHLLQRGELIDKIRAELTTLTKQIREESSVQEVKKIIRALTEDKNMDKDWDNFAQHFDKVHSDFTKQLHKVHPQITPNDLKLCTYLRMNLSSKEIARLMNISVRGVELSRYRLRKKLGLTTEVHLVDYLMKIGEPEQRKDDTII